MENELELAVRLWRLSPTMLNETEKENFRAPNKTVAKKWQRKHSECFKDNNSDIY